MYLAPTHLAVLAAIAADAGPQVTCHRPVRTGPAGAWTHYLDGRAVTAVVNRLVISGLVDRFPTAGSGGRLEITTAGKAALANHPLTRSTNPGVASPPESGSTR